MVYDSNQYFLMIKNKINTARPFHMYVSNQHSDNQENSVRRNQSINGCYILSKDPPQTIIDILLWSLERGAFYEITCPKLKT